MIDVNKPLEFADGDTRAVKFKYIDRDGDIVVSIGGDRFTRCFNPTTGKHIFGEYANIRNVKEPTMALDLNKPLTVNGKDAKVIHTFDNGNLAVVVDGYGEVQNFLPDGRRTGTTGFSNSDLKNKVVETVRYVNVSSITPDKRYSTLTSAANASVYIHPTFEAADTGRRKDNGDFPAGYNGFTVKQTLIDGKVVKNEIVG